MKAQTIKAYCCEYCSKISRAAGAMAKHERFCKKNPHNHALCYDCNFYQSSPHVETVPCDCGEPWEYEQISFELTPNRCTRKNCKLFNGLRWKPQKVVILKNSIWNYYPMPSVVEGCPYYEPAPKPAEPIELSEEDLRKIDMKKVNNFIANIDLKANIF